MRVFVRGPSIGQKMVSFVRQQFGPDVLVNYDGDDLHLRRSRGRLMDWIMESFSGIDCRLDDIRHHHLRRTDGSILRNFSAEIYRPEQGWILPILKAIEAEFDIEISGEIVEERPGRRYWGK